MKKLVAIFTITFGSIFNCSALYAGSGYKDVKIDQVQFESSNRIGYENVIYVLQQGDWTLRSSSLSCQASHAYYHANANANSHFTALILSARVTGTPIKVLVDDSYTKVDGFCQIVNISM